MTKNVQKPDTLWGGRATTAFKVFNWELFVKPRRWLMVSGFIIMAGCTGRILYELYSDQGDHQRIQRNKRVLQLAEEIKQKDAMRERQEQSEH